MKKYREIKKEIKNEYFLVFYANKYEEFQPCLIKFLLGCILDFYCFLKFDFRYGVFINTTFVF